MLAGIRAVFQNVRAIGPCKHEKSSWEIAYEKCMFEHQHFHIICLGP